MSVAPDETKRAMAFVVKLRDGGTRMWGNEVEVMASSPQDAAELVAGERLLGGQGERANLRARVWTLPHGSVPEIHFFTDTTAPAG